MRRRPPRARRRGETAVGPRAWLAVVFAVVASLLWIDMPVAALTTTVGPADRPAASADLSWLSVHDRHIVDEAGRIVQLHGFNTSTLLEPTVQRSPLDESDATMMERDGFNVVRLAVSWGRLEPVRGQWDTAYLGQIAQTVQRLNRHHIYVVIDMHFLDWSSAFGGSGAPAWAAVPGFPNLRWEPLGDWQRHLSPAVNAANTYFWLSPDWQADFAQSWQLLARRFRNNSGVAGYDLYNEPHAIPLPPVRFERSFMWPLYARTIDSIGAVDPNHLFIVEGQLFGDFGTTVVPLQAPNLVYSPHEYTGSLVPPVWDGNAQALDEHVSKLSEEASRVPAALWVGEWGMSATQAKATAWVDDVVSAFDTAGAGWAWWQWREDSSWGIRDTSGHTNRAMLAHLARPYLAASPPGVHARVDDNTGDLTLTVDAGSAGGTVDIAWPLLSSAAPFLSGSCTGSSQWDSVRARLTLTVAAGPACVAQVQASTATSPG
ncbi:MAG: glycoside hydrolase family 5 protein [Candidatus Dormibacteraeota bacterium]|nr:glycoside hydrolase family 5 protein [Candidatus Dormibacteraeota bacterium]